MPEVILRTIKIQDGISIDADKIEAIYKKDDNSCTVYIGTRAYECTYPYETFIEMLNSERVISKGLTKDEQITETMNKLEGVLNKVGHFAG